MAITDETLCIILAGGVGSRLHPLTLDRAKPAVPFGGKYRIIDFTLTNCMHSGLRRLLVLTQYKSHSLQKHLRDGWSIYNPEISEYITPIPPQMRTGTSWYAGTADAIYQNLYLLQRSGAKYVLILSGDHIYRMDYAAMMKAHRRADAAVTVGCMQVSLDEARGFGVMNIDEDRRIVEFVEKPANPAAIPGVPGMSLASMGIYVFELELLCRILKADHHRSDSSHDFGKDILPELIGEQRVMAYKFGEKAGRVTPDRYWRDVGTIDAYFEANLDLLKPIPPLNLYQSDWPIRTYNGQHPPARMIPSAAGRQGELADSILGGGTIICGGSVNESILFSSVFVDDRAEVDRALLLDHVRVGAGARLRNCIVDKGVKIPPGETIGLNPELDAQRFTVSESGIVVVPKDYQFSSIS